MVDEYQQTNDYTPAILSRVYNYGLNLISQQQFDTNSLSPSTLSYYGFDGHGSVRFLMNTNGSITDTYIYDAYGNLLAANGTTPNLYLYSGQQYDPDLKLYYNRARYLNADTGRFWSSDTYSGNDEDPLSLHKYLYAQDDPVDGSDPSGQFDVGFSLGSLDIGALSDSFSFIVPIGEAIAPLVDFKFEVVRGEPGIEYFMPHGADGHWGQPSWSADGHYSKPDRYITTSWVKVWSRDSAGGACNTVNKPDPAGTIILFMKSPSTTRVSISANVNIILTGTGPIGGAQAKVEADSGKKILDDVKCPPGQHGPVNQDKQYNFDANVGTDWTPVLKYVPTISFPKDNGHQSTGRADGTVTLHNWK